MLDFRDERDTSVYAEQYMHGLLIRKHKRKKEKRKRRKNGDDELKNNGLNSIRFQ